MDSHLHSVEAARDQRIYRACLIPHALSFESSEVEKLNELTRERVSSVRKLLGFAIVDPFQGVPELDRAVKELGLKALVLDTRSRFSFSQDELWQLMEKVEEMRVPVFIHSEPEERGFEIDEANEVTISFPRVDFIFSGMGMGREDDFPRVVNEPNVYYETSGVGQEKLTLALETISPSKIIFGSSAEQGYPTQEIEKIKSLSLEEEEEAGIFYLNIARLLNLELPEEKSLKSDLSDFISNLKSRFQ